MEDTPENRQAVQMIAELTMNLYRATLVGHPAPSVAKMRHLILHPRVGDLVLEISGHRRPWFEGRLGWLQKVAKEPIEGEWDEEQGGPRPQETYYYIQGIDGQEHRWYNCHFIRVLDRPVDTLHAAGETYPSLERA